jgi:excisionase family DNA binding protein
MEKFNDIDSGFNHDIMTPKQVAEYLMISPRTVYSRWEKLGGLRIGRTLRFRKETLDALFRPEEKKVERGGEKRRTAAHSDIQNENGSEKLGSRKEERAGNSGASENRNRHGLLDG